MARAIRRTRHGVDVGLDQQEIEITTHFLDDVESFLAVRADETVAEVPQWAADLGLSDVGSDGALGTPDDPALARLLPDGTRGDDDLALDFRRLTESSVRSSKITSIRTARDALQRGIGASRLYLSDAEAVALLRALTDVRLVMAQRIGIETDDDAEALHDWLNEAAEAVVEPGRAQETDPGEEAASRWLAQAYEFFTWVQESLAEVLAPRLPDDGDGRRKPPPSSD